MTDQLNILIPEVFLSLSIFSILMFGVFTKKSFNIVFNLVSLVLILTILIIINNPNDKEKIFLESFSRDSFRTFLKF